MFVGGGSEIEPERPSERVRGGDPIVVSRSEDDDERPASQPASQRDAFRKTQFASLPAELRVRFASDLDFTWTHSATAA